MQSTFRTRRISVKADESQPKKKNHMSVNAIEALTEVITTYLLVLVGTGCVAINGTDDTLLIALTFGLTVAVLVKMTKGQFNPAVTLAVFICDKHYRWLQALFNIGCQMIGAILGSITVKAITRGTHTGLTSILAINTLSTTTTVDQGFLVEALLTGLLVLVVLMTKKQESAAQSIGLTVFFAHVLAIKLTGCGINPARSFGPAVVSQTLGYNQHWLYWIAPFTGAIVVALIHRFVSMRK